MEVRPAPGRSLEVEFDLQAARAIEHAIDHHARFARRRPKRELSRATKPEPSCRLESCALHIGLDREPARADEIREVVDARARGLHRALVRAALDLDALADQQGIDAAQLQPANMQAVEARARPDP